MPTLKADANHSQLVLIDLQEKLMLAMPPEAMQHALKATQILASAASALNIPVLVTEQYPKGLGHTDATLLAALPAVHAIEKTAFSACAAPAFTRQLTHDKPQLILAGLEAHICVLQTALDLLQAGKSVLVVEDAIISRNTSNKANAIARMRQAGCIITNVESVLFEWLGDANHEAFKALSKLIK